MSISCSDSFCWTDVHTRRRPARAQIGLVTISFWGHSYQELMIDRD